MEIVTTIVVFLLIFLVFMLNLVYIHVSNTKYLVAAIFFSAFFSFPDYSEAKVVTDLQANLCRSAHTLSVICLRLFLNYQPPRMHELHTFRANEAGLRGCTHFPPVPSALSDQNERSGWKEINVQALIHWGTYPIGWLTGTKLVSGRLLENIYSVVGSERAKDRKDQTNSAINVTRGQTVKGVLWDCSVILATFAYCCSFCSYFILSD